MLMAMRKENTLGAILLVAGCCIGAGMIGLPVLSAASGFLPSSIAMLFTYLFTTATGLLLLEASLWFDRKVNLFTLSQATLGKWGKVAVGILFLSLFYTIFVAYLDASAQILSFLPKPLSMALSALFISATIYRGFHSVDWINRLFMIGLFLSYIALMIVGLPHIEPKNLTYTNWPLSLSALPILLICFGYHNLIPSLSFHLQKTSHLLRSVIVIGNMIPFLFYFLWNFVILGMISDPATATQNSSIVTDLLQAAHQSSSILSWVNIFCFFALFTSFITTALSFVDFLRDAFTTPPPELFLHALVLLPPLAISLTYPSLFLTALSFAGGFINVLLFGILPIAIVWKGRYTKTLHSPYPLPGGKPALLFLLLLCFGFLLLNL